jgi:hypothetical protein
MQLGTAQGMFVRWCGDKGPGLKPPFWWDRITAG